MERAQYQMTILLLLLLLIGALFEAPRMFFHFFTQKRLHPAVMVLLRCLMNSLSKDLSGNIYFVLAKLIVK